MSGIYTTGQAVYFRFAALIFLLLALCPVIGWGQTKAIPAIGVSVLEDFNGLAATGTTASVLPNGVYFNETGSSSNVNTTYSIGTGSNNAVDTYSFGSSAGAIDRALGSISASTLTSVFGVAYTNTTGQTINQLTITYTGEQYRLGTPNRADRLDFQYSTNATTLTNGSYSNVDQLDFTTPTAMGGVGALDGNAAANRTVKSYTITGLTIVNGGVVWLRFVDFDATGNDDGLAVDDLSVIARVMPPNADTTPPSFTITFPAIGSITATSFSLLNSLSEAGTAYYVVLPDGAAAPTAAQVKNAQTAANTPVAASFSGNIPVAAANTIQTSQITGLAASTAYDVYVVAEDVAPNLQAAPVKLDVSTLALAAAPEINIQQAGADVLTGATYNGFAATAVGSSDARSFTIQNVGTLALTLTGQPPVVLSSMGVAQFAVTTQPGATVGAAGTTTFVVTFTPTSAGTKTARLTINSNDADEAVYTINLSAVAVAVPTLTTTAVSTITTTTAETGGNVTATGDASIMARGVVYSTMASPRLGAAGVLDEPAANSPGTGSYSSSLRNLAPGTTYYVAAYATNSVGTGYGADQVFTTLTTPVIPPLLAYDFAGGDTPSSQAANVTGTTFSRAGVLAAAATGRYNSSDWPITSGIDLNRYVEFSFAPATSYEAELTSLSFVDQTSATGPTRYEIRSSLDNYASPVASGSTSGGLKTTTLNNFSGLLSGVTFRFYAFASASNAGTYSVDDVNLYGTVAVSTTPVLTTSVAALSFTTQVNTTATAQSYTLDGRTLPPNSTVTVTAPASFEVSVTSATTGFATQQALAVTAAGTLTQQVWVRFVAGVTPGTTLSVDVVHDASGTIATVEVTGTATPAPGLVRWDGGGDGVSFADAQNWNTNVVPTTNDDVLLDHSVVAGAYTVTLPAVASGTLSLGSFVINPGSGPGITAILPSTNTANNYLRLTKATAAFVLYTGATFINNSGSNGGTPVDVVPNGQNFIIYNGGRYVHRTPRSATALIDNLSAAAGTETGLFEFDVNSGSVTISASGRTFGSLAFRATTASAQSYVSSGNAPLVVRGSLSTDANVSLTVSLDASISLAGNLLNAGTFRFSPAGQGSQQLIFNGTVPQTVSGSALTTLVVPANSGLGANVDVVLNNATGLTLSTPLRVNGGLVLTNGVLTTTATNLVTVVGSVSNTSSSFVSGPLAREVSATGAVAFPIGKNGTYRPLTLNISSAPAGSTTYTAEQQEGAPTDQALISPVTRISRVRYYTVTPSPLPAPNTLQATIELSFGSNDGVNDPTDPTFVVAKSNGSGWSSIGRSRSTATSLVSAPFTSFSSFVLASTAGLANPLPVTLTSFSAAHTSQGVELRWTTASETNNAAFEVQRSTDGRRFATVATVAGQGQSSRPHYYTTLDREPLAGVSYYRLRQLDYDGTESFSPVVAVASGQDVALYPVPARTTLTVVVPSAGAHYRILDTAGRALLAGDVSTSTTTVNVAPLPVGLYQMEITSGTGRVMRKFTKAE